MDKKTVFKYLQNFILFVALIVATFLIIFKNQDMTKLLDTLRNSNLWFILLGLATMFGFICMEAFNIGRMLKHIGEKSTFLKNLKYAFVGIFFSAITPAASGGQPMQIYYMHKDGIKAGSATFTLLINITCVLFVTISLSLINLIFNYQYMEAWTLSLFIFGTFINVCAIVLFMIAMFSVKILDKMVELAKRFLKGIAIRSIKRIRKLKKETGPLLKKIIKKTHERCDKRIATIEEHANKYKSDAKLVKENKMVVLKTLGLYYIQYGLYYFISYWAYKAIGLFEHNWFEISSLQSVVYATVSGIPSPGAVGISEAVYLGLFKYIIPSELISSIMLLTRCMNFYFFVLIAGIVVIVSSMRLSRREHV